MVNMNIPAGFGFVAGRGQDRARQVLDATKEAGFDPQTVLTRSGGYLAPLEAIDLINEQDNVAANVDDKVADTKAEEEAAAKAKAEEEAAAEQAKADAEAAAAKAAEEAAVVKDSNVAKFAEATDETKAAAAEDKPAGNASTDAFAEWATKHFGYDAAEALSRAELIARYSA